MSRRATTEDSFHRSKQAPSSSKHSLKSTASEEPITARGVIDFIIDAIGRATDDVELRLERKVLSYRRQPLPDDDGRISISSSPLPSSTNSSCRSTRGSKEEQTSNTEQVASRQDIPTNPPNTPNSPSQPTTSMKPIDTPMDTKSVVREEKAREAAVCLLKGLGTLDKPALHRSPAISAIGTPSHDRGPDQKTESWYTYVGAGLGKPVPVDEETLKKWNAPALIPGPVLKQAPAGNASLERTADSAWTVDFDVRPRNNPSAPAAAKLSCELDAQGKPTEVHIDGRRIWQRGAGARSPGSAGPQEGREQKPTDSKNGSIG